MIVARSAFAALVAGRCDTLFDQRIVSNLDLNKPFATNNSAI